MSVTDELEESVQLRRFVRIEPGCRLVEAQQDRVRTHGASDLQLALRAIRQVARVVVGTGDQTDPVEPVPRPFDCVALGVPVAGEADQPEDRHARRPHQNVVLGDEQVLEHAHRREQADVLEGAGDARGLGNAVTFHPLQQVVAAATVQPQTTDRRAVKAREAVEHCRLARTVRPDDGGDRPRIGGEGDVVDGDEAAEPHRQMLDGEKRLRRPGIGRGNRAHGA